MASFTRQLRRERRCVRLGACAALPPYLGVLYLVPVQLRSPCFAHLGQRFHSDLATDRLQQLGRSISVEVSPNSDTDSAESVSAILRREQLPPNSCVFVNMVKTTADHFSNVAETSRALFAEGYDPIPHLPISRLSTAEDFHATLEMLTQAGAKQLLLVAGNDLPERLKNDELRYRSVSDLLKAEIETIKSAGIQSVALAGLPDSPQWRGWSEKAATKVLVDKARLILEAGLQVVVATQFCFNPRHLLRWLGNATSAMEELQREVEVEDAVSFRIGVPGPTQLQKLRRISDICQVPRGFLHPSMFDLVLQGATRVSPSDLEQSFDPLGLGRTDRSATPKLRAELFDSCRGADGLLGRAELADVLWQDLQAEAGRSPATTAVSPGPKGAASGPSVFVATHEDAPEGALFPEDVLWALATQPSDKIMVNLYPFGGLVQSLSLARSLRQGGVFSEAA